MANYRPLHEVIVSELVHLATLYTVEAGEAGCQDTKLRLGAEIEALCAVLDNGIVPRLHLEEVIDHLRRARDEHLDVGDVRVGSAAARFNTLIMNLAARGESVDGLRPLHEVLLRWLEHQVGNFGAAVRGHDDDRVFFVGVEIQACCHALQHGVVPEGEIRGAAAWLERLVGQLPRGGGDPMLDTVTAVMCVVRANLEGRRPSSPDEGALPN